MITIIMCKTIQRISAIIGLAISLLLCANVRVNAQQSAPPLTAAEVVNRMVAMSDRRNESLRSYSSVRSYTIDFNGIKHLHAEMVVSMNYHYPNKKDLTILSESGSGTLRQRVLRPLLQAELEAMEPDNLRRSAISPDNYTFELIGDTQTGSGDCYVFEVRPRHKNKFLFKGRIWVDAKGFAITRVVGEPAVNPSWWTKATDFERAYKPVEGFWLPAWNQSLTHVRIFGQARLKIDYGDYQLQDTRPSAPISPVSSSLLIPAAAQQP